MNEIRKLKLKRGISTKRGNHLIQYGQIPFDEWEEQPRSWSSSWAPPASPSPRAPTVSFSPRAPPMSPSPRAPPASPTGTPRTPGGKKPVLGKVKSKAKKWMQLLHPKKKPVQEELMWTPRAGPSINDSNGREEQHDFEHPETPSTAQHAPSNIESEQASEAYVEASPRQNSPIPSPKARQENPYFMISSRFESEMKEANEMLLESKQLRVKTSKQKNVTFAPMPESGLENKSNGWRSKELSEAATEIFRDAYATIYEVALRMVSRMQGAMVAYHIDRRYMLEKVTTVNRYLMLKMEPGEDDKVLAEAITDAVLNLLDAWSESVERPLLQRANEICSWFLQRKEDSPIPPSTHPCECEDAEEFYSLEEVTTA